jgi:tripartite-type tricarboxylate transporter receptor subunit TctC
VPAGTPRDIVILLQREIVAIIGLPDMRQRLSGLGFDPVGSTGEEFAAQMKLEMEKWASVIRAAHLKAR